MTTIRIRITRPTLYRGQRQEVGTTLTVEPLDAADLLDSGKAVLCTATDSSIVTKAVQAATAKTIKAAGAPWAGPQVSPPWQRIQ